MKSGRDKIQSESNFDLSDVQEYLHHLL